VEACGSDGERTCERGLGARPVTDRSRDWEAGRRGAPRAMIMRVPWVRYGVGVLGLAVAYYAAGRASLALHYEGPVAALWLPSGLGAALLYRARLRWWPGLLIGDLALIDPSQPLASALGITAGNIADMVVMAVLLRSLLGPRAALDRLEQVGGALVAILAGALITATVATLCSGVGGVVAASELPEFWRSWLLADACGSLVVIPLVLAWTEPRSRAWPARAAFEGPLVLIVVVALSAASLSAALPLSYMVFPALIWAALRFGSRGATLAVALAAAMTVGLTAAEFGAFVEHSISDRALSTQLYIAIAALTTLCLAALDSERRRALREVAASRARIVAAGAHERRRLELELHDTAQSRLIALLIRISLLQERVPAGSPEIIEALDELIQEAESLGEELRRLAHGISPPLLASGGVVSALLVECADSAVDVRISAGDIDLSTPEAEIAVYRCCLEAVQDAAEHGGPDTSVIVRLRSQHNVLTFSVLDDGPAFDRQIVSPGASLTALRDRIESVGGHLDILTGPGRGTAVVGSVPWPPRTTRFADADSSPPSPLTASSAS
jgi:integral membrane sensor domain MASE1